MPEPAPASDQRSIDWAPARRWLLLFALFCVALAGIDLAPLGGRLGLPADAAGTRWLTLVLVSALATANFWLLARLPNPVQVAIVWAELLTLFLLFFYSFGLSYPFIAERAPQLLGFGLRDGFLQGAALTLFICAVAIACSTLIALVAALARLSGNGAAFGVATFYISFFRGTPLLLQVMLIYLGLRNSASC